MNDVNKISKHFARDYTKFFFFLITESHKHRTSPGREILCYTSTYDIETLKDSINSCTTLVHQGHDLKDLSTSGKSSKDHKNSTDWTQNQQFRKKLASKKCNEKYFFSHDFFTLRKKSSEFFLLHRFSNPQKLCRIIVNTSCLSFFMPAIKNQRIGVAIVSRWLYVTEI